MTTAQAEMGATNQNTAVIEVIWKKIFVIAIPRRDPPVAFLEVEPRERRGAETNYSQTSMNLPCRLPS